MWEGVLCLSPSQVSTAVYLVSVPHLPLNLVYRAPHLRFVWALRIREKRRKYITGWFKKLRVLQACMFGKTVRALWEAIVPVTCSWACHRCSEGYVHSGLSVSPHFLVFLVLVPDPPLFCTCHGRTVFLLTRTLFSDPASSIQTTLTSLERLCLSKPRFFIF